jgi:hypothetical protein
LVRRAKAQAALQGLTLKDFIIQAIAQAINAGNLEVASKRALFVAHKPLPKRTKHRRKRRKPRQ